MRSKDPELMKKIGVFIDQFKCLPAGILAVPDERAVGVVRILGFQLGAVLRER